MGACEFCLASVEGRSNRFSAIYPHLTSRIVAETEHFVAMPTIGQLFLGSLLILPRTHIETSAKMKSSQKDELICFLNSLARILNKIGYPICFEHGALACTGGACGVYHAHLHLVPLPQRLKAELLFPEFTGRSQNLSISLDQFTNCDEYLLIGDDTGFIHAPIEDMSFKPQSQFLRKRLADYFGLTKSWDWHQYTSEEPYLLKTIEFFDQTLMGNRRLLSA
jgi:diadenosine tetraphosphate (Ap4A) HIT family hydrolase